MVITINGFWKTSPFTQFLCQTQILILEIPVVLLRLKLSSPLILNKIEIDKIPKEVSFHV